MINCRIIAEFKNMSYRIIYLFIILLCITALSSVHAQNPEVMFNDANKAYAEGDYQSAIELYSTILEQGIESGEVYFNLGNAYFKSNEIGRAILNYEKAAKFIDGDLALEQNLQLSRLRIVDKIEPIPELFFIEWWSAITHLLSLETLLWLCIIVFSIVMLLIIMNLLYRNQYFRRFIWATSALSLILFVVTFSLIYEFETMKFGVILEEKVSVVSEPDISGTEVFILHEGTKVKINRTLNDWLEISIPDGKTGWLRDMSLEVI